MVEPERHPRDRDSHRARHIHCHHEKGELTSKEKFNPETRVGASGSDDVAVFAAVGAELEAAGKGEVAGKLDRVLIFPNINQVALCPPICKWKK